MPAESLVALCALFNQIEADTKTLVARMDAVNEQAARFSVPVGWENIDESFLTKIQPMKALLDTPDEPLEFDAVTVN